MEYFVSLQFIIMPRPSQIICLAYYKTATQKE
jgi:hypothetical protein